MVRFGGYLHACVGAVQWAAYPSDRLCGPGNAAEAGVGGRHDDVASILVPADERVLTGAGHHMRTRARSANSLKDVGYYAGYFQKMRAEVGPMCIISLWLSMAPASRRSRQWDGTAHAHWVTCTDAEQRRPVSRSEASDEPRLAPREALPPRSRGPGGGPSSEPEGLALLFS